MPDIRIKRGEALILEMHFRDDDDAPIDVTDVVLTGQVRTVLDALVANLTFTKNQAALDMAVVQVADTTAWPYGALRCDIRAVMNALPVASQTFAIYVDKEITR